MRMEYECAFTILIIAVNIGCAVEITEHPKNASVLLGETAVFTCKGKGEIIDFWIFNGKLIADDEEAGFMKTNIHSFANESILITRSLSVQTSSEKNNTWINCIVVSFLPAFSFEMSEPARLLVDKALIFDPSYPDQTYTQVGDKNNITCVARATSVSFLINGISAAYQSNFENGFTQSPITTIGNSSNIIQRTLSVTSSVENNNTNISCKAISSLIGTEIDVEYKFITKLIVNGASASSQVNKFSLAAYDPVVQEIMLNTLSADDDIATVKIVVPPNNVTVVLGKDGIFTCEAKGVVDTYMFFLVNGEFAAFANIAENGFILSNYMINENTLSLNLTAHGREYNNNSEIICGVLSHGTENQSSIVILSEPVFFKVQGPLASVAKLYVDWLNSSIAKIIWKPPYTLPGVNITGYNLSFTELTNDMNKLIPDVFVDGGHQFYWQNTNCALLTISAYNGLDGTTSSRLVAPPFPSVTIIINNSINFANKNVSISFILNISNIAACFYQFKMSVDVILYEIDTNHTVEKFQIFDDIKLSNLTEDDTFVTSYMITLPANKQYAGKTVIAYHPAESSDYEFHIVVKIFEPTPLLNVTLVHQNSSSHKVAFKCEFLGTITVNNAKGCLIQLASKFDDSIHTNNATTHSDNNVTVWINDVPDGEYILEGIESGSSEVLALYIDHDFKIAYDFSTPTALPTIVSPIASPTISSITSPTGFSTTQIIVTVITAFINILIICSIVIMWISYICLRKGKYKTKKLEQLTITKLQKYSQPQSPVQGNHHVINHHKMITSNLYNAAENKTKEGYRVVNYI